MLSSSTVRSGEFLRTYKCTFLSFPLIHLYSYRTTLCLQYDATHIAIAAIFLAAIKLDTKPLNRSKAKNQVERTWYELLETDIEEEALKSTYIHFTYNFVRTFGDFFF